MDEYLRWPLSTPEEQGLNPRELEGALSFLQAHAGSDGVEQTVVLRHGVLVWHGERADQVHGIWSATKSLTSTVLGLLIDDGRCTLDTPAYTVLPEMREHYAGVTLRHFTTMTSGYRAVGDEPRGTYRHGPSLTPFVPSPEPLFPPGTHFAYWDSAMNQFGHVLTVLAGEPMAALFRRRIGDPIGIDPARWRWGELGKADGLAINGGSGNNQAHVFTSASELARLGQLFLQRGRWEGRQLIGSAWVSTATAVQVPAELPLAGSVAQGPGMYGFNWWVNGVGPDGSRKWPGAPAGTFSASGYNNNDMFVLPEWDMVIVRLGLDEEETRIDDETYGQFLSLIGQALSQQEDG